MFCSIVWFFSLVLADLSDKSILLGSYGSNLLDSPQYNVLGMPVVPTNMTLTFKFTPTGTSPSGGTIIRWTEFTPGLNMPTISMLPDSYDFIVCVDGADYLYQCTPQSTALKFIPNVSSTVTIIFSGASFDVFINNVFKYRQALPSAPLSNSKAFLLAGDTRSNGIEASGILTHVSIGSTVYNQTTTGYTNLMKPNDFSPLGDVLDVPESVNITFQIKPLGVRSNWASILRMTTNFASRGTAGDRLPAIFFNPNSYSLQICVDGTTWVSGYSEVGCIAGTEDPLLTLQPNVLSTVTVLISDKMVVYVNNQLAHILYLPAQALSGVNAFVWAGEPYGPSKANALLSLVEISETVTEAVDLPMGMAAVNNMAGTQQAVTPTTKVNLTGRADRGFSFKGFGTSLAWFANVFGNRTDLADIMFNCTANNILFMGRSVPTLCMEIVRYNIGASGPRMKGVGMFTYKMIPQFQNEFGTWDWNADITQRNMLKNAVARGVNFVEAFANSPPWWMTTANSSAGGVRPNGCLLPSKANTYAVYLAKVVAQFKNVWKINITSVVASNEPLAGWGWYYPENGQEGCMMSLSLMNQVNSALRSNLQKEGVPITIAAFDDNNYYDAMKNLRSNPNLTAFDKFNFHTYGNRGTTRMRTPIRDWGKRNNKEIWVDEYADGDVTGATTAIQIVQDINYAGASAWIYWQSVRDWNPGQTPKSRGFINATFNGPNNGSYMPSAISGTLGEVWTKYFVFAHFSRHIKPGFILIKNSDMDNTLTFTNGAGTIIIVTVNSSKNDRPFQMNLKLTAGSRIKQWYTHFEKSDTQALYTYYGGVPLNVAEGNVWVNVRARSIQTMEITNVSEL